VTKRCRAATGEAARHRVLVAPTGDTERRRSITRCRDSVHGLCRLFGRASLLKRKPRYSQYLKTSAYGAKPPGRVSFWCIVIQLLDRVTRAQACDASPRRPQAQTRYREGTLVRAPGSRLSGAGPFLPGRGSALGAVLSALDRSPPDRRADSRAVPRACARARCWHRPRRGTAGRAPRPARPRAANHE
jgi:hypothetical protein